MQDGRELHIALHLHDWMISVQQRKYAGGKQVTGLEQKQPPLETPSKLC